MKTHILHRLVIHYNGEKKKRIENQKTHQNQEQKLVTKEPLTTSDQLVQSITVYKNAQSVAVLKLYKQHNKAKSL